MRNSVIAYHNLKVSTPYEIKSLSEIKIENSLNEHSKVYISGIISDEMKESYAEKAKTQDIIEVIQVADDSKEELLFKGFVTGIAIKSVRGVYYIEIEGLSNTFQLDIKLKKRSFQNEGMSYKDVVKKILSDYEGADFIDTASNDKKIEKFIVQYNETDWEFIKRMASRFNTGLIADVQSGGPKFWFGVPGGSSRGQLDEYHYNVNKELGNYRLKSRNLIKGIIEEDFVYYEIETDKLMNIGDSVNFKERQLLVFKSCTEIKNSMLKHTYVLASKGGLSQDTVFNEKVKGSSIEGKVIDIKNDYIRVHLDIDKEQKKEEAYWFPYSTFYSTEGQTGWYCMPELNDSVKLYFPSEREELGIVMDSMRRRSKGGDKIGNPDIKYFRTRFGKEAMFSEKEIVVTGKDEKIFIKLNEDNGIEMYSEKEVKIVAGNNLEMMAKKIKLNAASELDLICRSSSIMMEGTTHIRGSTVRIDPNRDSKNHSEEYDKFVKEDEDSEQ